jgi:hypothetical protein
LQPGALVFDFLVLMKMHLQADNPQSQSHKYPGLSEIQKEQFLSIAGYLYKGDEHKGMFRDDLLNFNIVMY